MLPLQREWIHLHSKEASRGTIVHCILYLSFHLPPDHNIIFVLSVFQVSRLLAITEAICREAMCTSDEMWSLNAGCIVDAICESILQAACMGAIRLTECISPQYLV